MLFISCITIGMIVTTLVSIFWMTYYNSEKLQEILYESDVEFLGASSAVFAAASFFYFVAYPTIVIILVFWLIGKAMGRVIDKYADKFTLVKKE